MSHPYTLCIFYLARLRQQYIWQMPDKKTKYRTRKMTEQEIEQTKLSCLKVGVELKNF